MNPLIFLLLPVLLAVPGWTGGDGSKPDDSLKHCDCIGPQCQCCVDFNITYIDLGGPGCVKMKYLSQDEGIMVNVSYGDSQLHQGHIKGGNETSTCMDILLELAQMCARFNSISRTESGLLACASLEPTLLGDPQDSYHLGCFEMAPDRMRLLPSSPVAAAAVETQAEGGPQDNGDPVGQGISFLEAVNESAEHGIAWFTNFWEINFNKAGPNATQPNPT